MIQQLAVSIPEKREIPFEGNGSKWNTIPDQMVSIPEKREIPFEEFLLEKFQWNTLVSIPEKREIPFEEKKVLLKTFR